MLPFQWRNAATKIGGDDAADTLHYLASTSPAQRQLQPGAHKSTEPRKAMNPWETYGTQTAYNLPVSPLVRTQGAND